MKLHDFSQPSEFRIINTGYSDGLLLRLESAVLRALSDFVDYDDEKAISRDYWDRLTQWIEDPELSSLLCGEEMTSQLEQLFGGKLVVHPAGLPKISLSVAPWDGLPIHTDYDPTCRELTCCLWLTSLTPDQGGTLILYDAQKRETQRITPERGKIFAFVPSATTWHSVSPFIHGNRISILYS